MPEETTEQKKKTGRRSKPRHPQVILGALEENARMLLRDPHSEGIGARISELLDELGRGLENNDEAVEVKNEQ